MANNKPTVYVETSIFSYLTSRLAQDPIVAGQMLETRKWWNDSRAVFDLYASDVVIDEISRGDPDAAAERLEKIANLPLLMASDAATDLAMDLISESALPAKAQVDAYHVGIAATSGIEFLLTWNCRHLANAALRTKIEKVCANTASSRPSSARRQN
ncbi:MAG: hypothetical protein QOF78_3781 [Phycisphaerales bacterium]|nr:hypothetical protein [Phycisphaerales bacterium]